MHEGRELTISDLACSLAGEQRHARGLIHDDASYRVFLARDEAFVLHRVDDLRILVCDDKSIEIECVISARADLGVYDLYHLVFVVDIGMYGNRLILIEDFLECDDLSTFFKVVSVEGELDLYLTIRCGRREGCLSFDGVAVIVSKLTLGDAAILIDDLLHELARCGVFFTNNKVLVRDGIDHAHALIRHDVLIAINAVESGSADLRDDGLNGLVGVGRILVRCDYHIAAKDLFEHHDLSATIEH